MHGNAQTKQAITMTTTKSSTEPRYHHQLTNGAPIKAITIESLGTLSPPPSEQPRPSRPPTTPFPTIQVPNRDTVPGDPTRVKTRNPWVWSCQPGLVPTGLNLPSPSGKLFRRGISMDGGIRGCVPEPEVQ